MYGSAQTVSRLWSNDDSSLPIFKESSMKRTFAAIALAVTVGSASAILPDSGWYFNPTESGRGFNIEIQNNVLFMAGFLYDTTGKPIWIVTGGPMSSDRTYSGAALQTANGQVLGGSYHAATGV